MKKSLKVMSILSLILIVAVGCSSNNSQSETINLISREEGSGTRGAFVEIVGLDEDDNDMTYEEATIQNSTDGVMTTVAGDKNAIGYISLGSLNETVTALKIDNVQPSLDTVKSGEYKIARPFILGYKDLNDIGNDFLKYIMSIEGQEQVANEGYVPLDSDYDYISMGSLSGNLVISGSTSVTPLMEIFKEKYEELNNDVSIEIQSNGSSTGIQTTIEGAADIAMSSRELKAEELDALNSTTIAMDGIAVIVNKNQSILDLSLDNLKEIYLGNITEWNKISE